MTTDKLIPIAGGVFKRLKDMGDGTHAEVVVTETSGGSGTPTDPSGVVSYEIASDGTYIPVDSLAINYAGSTGANGVFTSTLVYKGVTYKETITYDANGNLDSKTAWVAQP